MLVSAECLVLLALALEVFCFVVCVPLWMQVSQWEHGLRTQKTPTLMRLRQWRREVKELRYAVESVPEWYALPLFKRWKNTPWRWIVTYCMRSK